MFRAPHTTRAHDSRYGQCSIEIRADGVASKARAILALAPLGRGLTPAHGQICSAAPLLRPEPIEVNLREALEERYLAYALSTIMGRALPDARDGLKPVHRRILYGMHILKLDPGSAFKKCAKIVGDVMGRSIPMAIRRSTRLWCVWRRISPRAIR